MQTPWHPYLEHWLVREAANDNDLLDYDDYHEYDDYLQPRKGETVKEWFERGLPSIPEGSEFDPF